MTVLENMDIPSLLEAVCDHDSEAQNELVRRFQGQLTAHVTVAVNTSRENIEDIVQDIWNELFEKIRLTPEKGGYDPGKGSFYTYLTRCIAKFIILQWYDKLKKLRECEEILIADKDGAEFPIDIPDKAEYIPENILRRNEEQEMLFKAYREAFRLTFLCGGYPYQQMAFGFSKLIFGRISDRGVEGAPEIVHEKFGSIPLSKLVELFWTLFLQASQMDKKSLDGYYEMLEPLKKRLSIYVKDMFSLDSSSAVVYADLSECIVSRTSLQDYYSRSRKSYTSAIPNWCYKVEERLRSILGIEKAGHYSAGVGDSVEQAEESLAKGIDESSGCSHCKLRKLSPCKEKFEKLKPSLNNKHCNNVESVMSMEYF